MLCSWRNAAEGVAESSLLVDAALVVPQFPDKAYKGQLFARQSSGRRKTSFSCSANSSDKLGNWRVIMILLKNSL